MNADDFLAALDAALEISSPPGLAPSDKLALAVYWLVNRLAETLDVDPHVAALEVARSAETAAHRSRRRPWTI